MSLKIWFDVQQLYYLPQYEPVYQRLQALGHECLFIIYDGTSPKDILTEFMRTTHLPVSCLTEHKALEFYQKNPADWIIFGNSFRHLDQLPNTTKTALLYHGIGVKECYYGPELSRFDVRFTEGKYRQQELNSRYPNANFFQTGFAKIDPIASLEGVVTHRVQLEKIGLQSHKKTLLYAPTFYPSSIELMGKNWPAQFSDCNIIIKPHFFSYTNAKYSAQRKLIQHWASFSNVHVAHPTDISLLPYMAAADILISEASSALFEFAALDKPVIWLDFFKLRWGYRGPLRYRFTRRMDQTILKYKDVARHVAKPKDLEETIRSELSAPDTHQKSRQEITAELIGRVDGKAADRIADYLINHTK